MYLTKEEESILDGEKGVWRAKALKLLVKLGELNNADRLIGIKRAHLSGVSYKTVGDPILEMLEDMAQSGIKVSVFTTLNPSGIDLESWEKLGFPKPFVEKQIRIIKAFEAMGVRPTLTCTPYLFENRPSFGERIAFAESSAVIYANSIIGARTNRHGNLDALAAAIVGKVPNMGLLIDENRKADVKITVKFSLKKDEQFGLLGLYIGDLLRSSEIPFFKFEFNENIDEVYLRALGAALASSGGIPLFHVAGITPEAKMLQSEKEMYKGGEPRDIIDVTEEDIENFKERVIEELPEPDLIAIGCPHASLEEIERIARLVSGKRIKKAKRFWIFTSRYIKNEADRRGLLQTLENSGIQVLADTCMVVSPLEDMGVTTIITNSGKATFYIPKLSKNNIKASIYSLEDIVNLFFE